MCTNLTVHIPRLVAKMTMGVIAASRAFCKYGHQVLALLCGFLVNVGQYLQNGFGI